MSQSFHSRPNGNRTHNASRPSPLRHASNAFASSEVSAASSNPFAHTRSSTQSSIGSFDYRSVLSSHKRGISETSPTRSTAPVDYQYMNDHRSTPLSSRTNRESLKPLSQAPNVKLSPASQKEQMRPTDRSFENENRYAPHPMSPTSPPPTSPDNPAKQSYSVGVSRSDSRRVRQAPSGSHTQPPNVFEKDDLQKLGKSTTKELRALSKFAESGNDGGFTITKPDQEVTGLHGRRRFQRNAATRDTRSAPGYGGRTWMDTQRQFLQAYEYLCHIGEAKEWIEDVIHHDIAPIVQLEEALRDGVVLAEIVQTLQPQKHFRIFRNPRLQFRHSDNIAIFFRFLADMELPELFRFELVDLYEKKNIPKVIYCIHALSWLALRKGLVDFRIGNLVGQLQFEDHELEATQKGLDRAGVSMPNFSGMGEKFGAEPEPEPEPQETEEERIDRELQEEDAVILDLQSQVRGALERLRLGETMQHLWDHEDLLIDLQSRIRGDFARQISEYRLNMQRFAIDLQCQCRGFMVRSQQQSRQRFFDQSRSEVVKVQSLFRARKARTETQLVRTQVRRHEPGVRQIQAAIRGALARREVGHHLEDQRTVEPIITQLQHKIRGALLRKQHTERVTATRSTEGELRELQAWARGMLLRQRQQRQRSKLFTAQSKITVLQGCARAMQARRHHEHTLRALHAHETPVVSLQAHARALQTRASIQRQGAALASHLPRFISLQSCIRASKQRGEHASLKADLQKHSSEALRLQAASRAFLLRRRLQDTRRSLAKSVPQIISLQAGTRAYLERRRVHKLLSELFPHEDAIIELQSALRAISARTDIADTLEALEEEEQAVTSLQAEIRGNLVRKNFAEKQAYFEENMKRVIKVQSYVRGRQQGKAYESLTSGKNPPVNTVKNFVHLLNDSDLDFDEEMEIEKLRKAVGTRARDIEQIEQWITDVDAKIGLLAHNKITRDELKKTMSQNDSHRMAQRSGSVRETFNTKTLNKHARAKLEMYQQLFVILQTQTVYLARLFKVFREQGQSEEASKRLETLTISTYGFAQKRREEFYLLGLISTAIVEEAEACASFQDFQRYTFFFTRLFANYARAPRDRRYLREANASFIRTQFIETLGLDLESDPLQIYRSNINDEELRTGHRSAKPLDIPHEQAIKDPDVRSAFVRHLQDLRDVVDQYLMALEDSLKHAPYGARFIARQMFYALCERYPKEDQGLVLQFVGNWIWKTYLRPALADPEKSGTVERALDGAQKRNIGELVKVVNQVASGKHFGAENVYLQPLNTYLGEAIVRMNDFWAQFIEVADAEEHFEIDTMDDIHAKKAPTLYIKMADVFAIHRLIADNIRSLCLTSDDADLAEIIRDLGSVKSNELEMSAGGSTSDVTLTLSAKYNDRPDPDADIKNLFMETKRCILYIIRVQAGASLMEIMVKPITEEDHLRWEALVAEEQRSLRSAQNSQRRSRAYTDTTGTSSDHNANLADLATLSYPELKGIALENILTLEQRGRLSRNNNYQDILNEIALDIRQKHKRRLQRQREAEHVRLTLSALDEKAKYLDEKLDIFNKTFEMGLNTLQSKSQGKKRFLMPFSLQWQHEKELEKLGRMPKYGSFKYKAQSLLEKGILVSWRGRDLRDVEITIASDEVNVFTIEGSRGNMLLPGACDTFQWDDLLQSQYEEQREIHFFADTDGTGGRGNGGGVGELVLDREGFMRQVSKKFWPEG